MPKFSIIGFFLINIITSLLPFPELYKCCSSRSVFINVKYFVFFFFSELFEIMIRMYSFIAHDNRLYI